MRISLPTVSIGGVALTAMSGLAPSQTVAPPPPAAPIAMQAAIYGPQQFPAIRGEIVVLGEMLMTVLGTPLIEAHEVNRVTLG
jgi:hypothetical protein